MLNAAPLIWLILFFLRYYVRFSPQNDLSYLEKTFEKFQLSKREREIMKLIIQGRNNKEIEELLFISYHTVKNHIYNLYQKLGIKHRGELVHLAIEARKNMG
ncbi:MAG: helix-turn-helix transcriptional regulator [Candidatus Aminicenantes bacterium]|nr:helix-turn-helix transcriptional regulator [Candidatus Aminicenantes bacterium]